MDEGKLFVRSYVARWRGKDVAFKTKCHSDRVIPISPEAMDVLRERQARRVSEASGRGGKVPDGVDPTCYRVGA